MSNFASSTRCRPAEFHSNHWITLTMIVAMLGFAGQVFAAGGTKPVKRGRPAAHPLMEATPSGDATPLSGTAIVAPPVNDTCAGALTLSLGNVTLGDTTGAADDYQTPATVACYAGPNQQPTTAPGRDMAFKFTAPYAGNFSFRIVQYHAGNNVLPAQNQILYLTNDCTNPGTVNCITAANRVLSNNSTSSLGSSNGRSELIECHPMLLGETVYVILDDAAPGNCSNNNHLCFSDANCTGGANCVPALNGGGETSVEPFPCNPEVEPNDTPATANPYVCEMTGSTNPGPVGHCYLGPRAGNVCTRSRFFLPGLILNPAAPNSDTRCSISNAPCTIDIPTGVGTCGAGEGFCQQHTDLDCDARCDVGPNAGKSCNTQAFCNPVSDQGATCAGSCFMESTCVDTVTGVDSGVACTPVCVGSSIGSVNGRFCSTVSGCPGAGVCTQTPLVPAAGATCVAGQVCSNRFNEGDPDFFSLGVVPAGFKVFAGADGKAANDMDYRMRITTDTQTLQFDDDDGTTRQGQSSSEIAGALGVGAPTYVEITHGTTRSGGPYELYAEVRGPVATAQLEDESGPLGNDHYYYWNFDAFNANYATSGGYVRGVFGFDGDTDCFKYIVNKGEMMIWYGDGNPPRTAGSAALAFITQPLMYDAEPMGISNFGFGAGPRVNNLANAPTPGLRGITPAVTSSFFTWRASYTGMLEACFWDASSFVGGGVPAHPGPWAGTIGINCGPIRPAGPNSTTTDVSVTKSGPLDCDFSGADPVCTPHVGNPNTGSIITFQITVVNSAADIAQEIRMIDTLDPNLSYVNLYVNDTFGPDAVGNTACPGLPTPGTSDAPVDCTNWSMYPGQTTTYWLEVQVNNCIGSGQSLSNTATITTVSLDPNSLNDSSTATFTTAEDGSCQELFCEAGGNSCTINECRINGQCNAGTCESTDRDCNDNSICTGPADGSGLDVCVPAEGCVPNYEYRDGCEDFNACTTNDCDAVNGCFYPDAPAGTACDDGLSCTGGDACNGSGACSGLSVCDDANGCTDDFADELNSCACSHQNTAVDTPCLDNDACTDNTACDGNGACGGGTQHVCNDLDECTNDACDSGLGCVTTPRVCDDGEACNGVETCNSGSGCVAGSPIVCTPLDQCHVAGTCSGGTCSNPVAADGTACDDGNAGTSGDNCQAGVCTGSTCSGQPKPKSAGYYKKLCKDGHSRPYHGDELTAADAQCVGASTCTFAGISTTDDICAVFDHDSTHHDSNGPDGKACQKAEQELMALALNICRNYVCESQEVDSGCSGHDSHLNHTLTTVGASKASADAALCDPARNKDICNGAACLAKEINNGKGIHHISLTTLREGTSITKVRLNWENPVMDDGSGEASSYTIWRRALQANASFIQIGHTNNTTFVDNNAGTGNFEYEVTFTITP